MNLFNNIISFFEPPAVSIDFGRVYLKAVLLRRGRITACASAQATIGEPSAAAEFIKGFLAEHAPGCRRACLTLPENEGLVFRHLDIPVVHTAKINGVVEWQLKDELPGGAESHNIGWELNGESTGPGGEKKYRLAVLSAPADRIAVYLDLLSSCGLQTELVSYSPFNYGRMLRSGGVSSSILETVLDVGEEDSFVCIYKAGRLLFLRKLPFSCRKLASALTTSFTAGSRKVEYSSEEASRINQTFGIVQDEGLRIDEDVRGSHIISLMRPVLENLLRDIKSSFSYLRSSSGEDRAQKFILAGPGADIKNLGAYLAKELGIEYTVFSCLSACQGGISGRFLSAAGAAARDNSAMDLLPAVGKAKLRAEKLCRTVCICAALSLSLLFLLFFLDRGRAAVCRKETAGYAARLQSLEGIRAVKSVMDAGNLLTNVLRADNVPPAAVMKAVSYSAGSGIYLDQLSLNREKQEIVLRGTVNSSMQDAQRPLSGFADALKETGMFPDISLKYSSSGQDTSGFEIICRFVKKAS